MEWNEDGRTEEWTWMPSKNRLFVPISNDLPGFFHAVRYIASLRKCEGDNASQRVTIAL